MLPWEDTAPETQRAARPSRASSCNVLVCMSVLGFLATGLADHFFKDKLSFLAFDASLAIGRFQLWRFATYPVVQFVDFWFLFGFIVAAYALYTLGNELEAEVGPRRLLLYYFSFAAYGGLAHGAVQFAAGMETAAVSLFAPAYGISLVAALRNPSRPVLFLFVLPLRLITCVLLMGTVCLLYCALYRGNGVSPLPVVGAALAALAVVKLEPWIDGSMERAASRGERRRFLEEIEVRREADRLLDKISRQGMRSLTRADRRLLRKASVLANRRKVSPDG